jgi:hypothetical protein
MKSELAIKSSLRILTVRNQRVQLDTDLAKLYGVETRALNQAVKCNQDRFPPEFAFALKREEILSISQTVTSLSHLNFLKASLPLPGMARCKPPALLIARPRFR